MLWDTNREKDIYLAPSWPYKPLDKGECILPGVFKDQLKVGDKAEFTWYTDNLWRWIAEDYNKLADKNGWDRVPVTSGYNM